MRELPQALTSESIAQRNHEESQQPQAFLTISPNPLLYIVMTTFGSLTNRMDFYPLMAKN